MEIETFMHIIMKPPSLTILSLLCNFRRLIVKTGNFKFFCDWSHSAALRHLINWNSHSENVMTEMWNAKNCGSEMPIAPLLSFDVCVSSPNIFVINFHENHLVIFSNHHKKMLLFFPLTFATAECWEIIRFDVI